MRSHRHYDTATRVVVNANGSLLVFGTAEYPDDDFAMRWEVDAKSAKRMSDIGGAVRTADRVILVTDPDREGERHQPNRKYHQERGHSVHHLRIPVVEHTHHGRGPNYHN